MSVRVVTRWKGSGFLALVKRGLADNLTAAAMRVRDDIRRDISTHIMPRSAPGAPPHLETGDLLRSYFAFTDRKALSAEIGSPLVYSRFLETGTRFMAPRPHIRRNLLGNPAVRVILVRKIT